MTKKVGILTFHNTLNYGATLQCFALFQTLRQLGYEPIVIDYRSPAIETAEMPHWFTHVDTPKDFVRWMIDNQIKVFKKKAFDQFNTRHFSFLQIDQSQDVIRQCEDLAAVIVGSDQVWNIRITETDWQFFLPGDAKTRKISYAASFGSADFPDDATETASHLLSKFAAISVREDQGVQIVNTLLNHNVEQVLDPTFLIDQSDWLAISEQVNVYFEHYVLVYSTGANIKEILEKAQIIAKQIGASVVYLHAEKYKLYPGVKNILFSTPEQFVYLFQHAEYVVSGSFHGACFAVIMEKPLSVVLNSSAKNTNSRLTSLLSMIGSDAIYNGKVNEIDYDRAKSQLVNAKMKSRQFLSTSLHGI